MGCCKRPTPPGIRRESESGFDEWLNNRSLPQLFGMIVLEWMLIIFCIGFMVRIVGATIDLIKQPINQTEIITEQPAFWTER